jgi:hypothetical protein
VERGLREDLRRVRDGGRRDAEPLALLDGLLHREAGEHPPDHRVERARGAEPHLRVVVLRVRELVRTPEPLEHALPLALGQDADADPAVLRGEDRIQVARIGTPPRQVAQGHAGARAAADAEHRVQNLDEPLLDGEVRRVAFARRADMRQLEQHDPGGLDGGGLVGEELRRQEGLRDVRQS